VVEKNPKVKKMLVENNLKVKLKEVRENLQRVKVEDEEREVVVVAVGDEVEDAEEAI